MNASPTTGSPAPPLGVPPLRRYEWLIAALIIVGATVWLLPLQWVYLGDAASNNALNGLSLYEHGEPLFYRRGPVYYGIIALFYHLFGVSIESAVWVTRAFLVLNLGLLWTVTRTMFGPRAALAAAALAYLSYGLNIEAQKLELDNVLPFFMLAGLWLLWMAETGNRRGLALAAGLTLGVGFLVKEAAGLFLPLALLPLLTHGRSRRDGALLGAAYALGFVLPILPWAAVVITQTGSLAALAGAAGAASTVDHMNLDMSYTEYVLTYFVFEAPANFLVWVRAYLIPNFATWLAMAAALAVAVAVAARTCSRALVYLLAGVLLFAPITAYQGGIGERLGQCYIIFLLLYILLGWGVARLSLAVPGRRRAVFTVLVVVLALLEVVNPLAKGRNSTLHAWFLAPNRPRFGSIAVGALPVAPLLAAARILHLPEGDLDKIRERLSEMGRQDGFRLDERFMPEIAGAAAWLDANAPDTAVVATSGIAAQGLMFYTHLDRPVISYGKTVHINADPALDDGLARPTDGPVRGLVTYHRFRDPHVARYRLLILFMEQAFLDTLRAGNARYLLTLSAEGDRERYSAFWDSYLAQASWLAPIGQWGAIRLYEITAPPAPLPADSHFLYTGPQTGADLAWLRRTKPGHYEALVDRMAALGVDLSRLTHPDISSPDETSHD